MLIHRWHSHYRCNGPEERRRRGILCQDSVPQFGRSELGITIDLVVTSTSSCVHFLNNIFNKALCLSEHDVDMLVIAAEESRLKTVRISFIEYASNNLLCNC